MRELKFRAWDNLEKDYLNEEDMAINNLNNIFIFEIYDKNDTDLWYTRLLPDPDNKRYVIEQYTGLKDKNGTEIYEGDVVKVEGDGEIYRVEWIRSGFGLEPRYNSPRYPVLGNVELRKKIEVIGNIHENPELLEEK
nr:MAG TPA: YopX protein [Caudoviricetes sp.]